MIIDVIYFCRMCRYAFTSQKDINERVITPGCPHCTYPALEATRNTDDEIRAIAEGSNTEELEATRVKNLIKKREAMAKAREAKRAKQRTRIVG